MKDMICFMHFTRILSQTNQLSFNPNSNAGLGLFWVLEKQYIPIRTSSLSTLT